ncbi:MAG: hypothetical protein RBT11_09370 [Desulfobacterales bacterium]|jgi:hypothetical protein|nr:hypothetical protein [Desulfobacterales bacterium]
MTTYENDIVLIYFEGSPLCFARVESILPDSKPDWYHLKLLMLQIPLHVVTWILRDAYINGEPFTMNGKKMRLERIECPAEPDIIGQDTKKEKKPASKKKKTDKATVISFADLRKNSS